jgi:NAD(P)-dependent dehydrogenase (short-subunit alcohol dehydrogenase family)
MKVALVTGASRGIGKACAIRLAKDGYAVVINYSHSEEQAQKVLDEIVAAGGTAITYKADVSDLNQVKQMVKDVSKELGGIDVLVNNAGIVRDEYLLMLNKDTLDTCMDLNPSTLRSTYNLPSSLLFPPSSITSEQSWAQLSIISTPGIIGASGKCPIKYGSLIDTFLIPLALTLGSSSNTFSIIWKGGRCPIFLLISNMFIIMIILHQAR